MPQFPPWTIQPVDVLSAQGDTSVGLIHQGKHCSVCTARLLLLLLLEHGTRGRGVLLQAQLSVLRGETFSTWGNPPILCLPQENNNNN